MRVYWNRQVILLHSKRECMVFHTTLWKAVTEEGAHNDGQQEGYV